MEKPSSLSRISSFCIDFFLIFSIYQIVLLTIGHDPFMPQPESHILFKEFFLPVGIYAMYFSFLPFAFEGQTPGSKIFSLRLVSQKSNELSLPQLFLRTSGHFSSYALSVLIFVSLTNAYTFQNPVFNYSSAPFKEWVFLPFAFFSLLPYLSWVFHPEKRSLGDWFSGTQLQSLKAQEAKVLIFHRGKIPEEKADEKNAA